MPASRRVKMIVLVLTFPFSSMPRYHNPSVHSSCIVIWPQQLMMPDTGAAVSVIGQQHLESTASLANSDLNSWWFRYGSSYSYVRQVNIPCLESSSRGHPDSTCHMATAKSWPLYRKISQSRFLQQSWCNQRTSHPYELFIAVMNQLAKFMPYTSATVEQLHTSISSKRTFLWTPDHEEAFRCQDDIQYINSCSV